MERRLALSLVVVVLVVVGLLPLAAMLGKSFFVDGGLTLAAYEKLFADSGQHWAPIGHSLTLATLTAGAPSLIAALCVILVAATLISLAILASLLRGRGTRR